MKSVPVSVAKNNLSALLREVRGGATVVITDRGVPVAQLTPPAPTAGITPAAIELAQRGRLVLPQRAPKGAWMTLPPARRGYRVTAIGDVHLVALSRSRYR